jgi:hypothetical protein
MGFDGWALASMGSLMSSLSTRATRLATGATCRPVRHRSASLGSSRSAPLKPGVQQLATIVIATSLPPSRRCTSTASRRRSLPGQEIDPWAQVRDLGRAIAYARTRPEVDVDRIGVWGSSYSGGDVLELRGSTIALSASPPRHSWSTAPATPSAVRPDFRAPNRAAMQQDRATRFRAEPPAMAPLVDPGPMAVSAPPTPVTGSSSTWARHGRDDESQELSGGGESHVS